MKKMINQKGQTLIEALGAIAILGIIISATAVSVTTSVSNATFGKNQTLATKYAQEGTEIVHQIRDNNYANFQTRNTTYCLAENSSTLTAKPVGGCGANVAGFFDRTVQVTQNGCVGAGQIARVTVTVGFTDGKCGASSPYCHKQIDTSCLSTANPIPAP